MSKLSVKEIQAQALALVEEKSAGLRWGEFIRLIHEASPSTPTNTIHGTLQCMVNSDPEIIESRAGGPHRLKKFYEAVIETVAPANPEKPGEERAGSLLESDC
jgi:hypothetical protein